MPTERGGNRNCMNTYDQTTDVPRNVYERSTHCPTPPPWEVEMPRETYEPTCSPPTCPMGTTHGTVEFVDQTAFVGVNPAPFMTREEALTKAADWLRFQFGPGFYNLSDVIDLAHYYLGM